MRGKVHEDQLAAAADQKRNEKDYWLTQLSGELKKSIIPYDYRETSQNQRNMESVKFSISNEPFLKLLNITNKSDVRLNIILITLFVLLLERYTGNQDILVGTTIYRQAVDVNLINTILPIRYWVKSEATFRDTVLAIGQVIREAEKNQNYPYKRLLYQLNLDFSEKDDFPLFDITILLENIQDKKYIQSINLNLICVFYRKEQYIEGQIDYNSFRYRESTIHRIVTHFENLLRKALHDVNTKVSHLELLSDEEKDLLLNEFNHTAAGYPEDKTIHEFFAEQSKRTPDHTALVGNEEGWKEKGSIGSG